MILTVMNSMNAHYRLLIFLLNISLIISIVSMIVSGYESFEQSSIYESFHTSSRNNSNSSISLANASIIYVSIPMIYELLYDLAFIRRIEIPTNDHKIYDIIQFKVYFIIGYTLPALLLCVYNNNPNIQSLICCVTFTAQNLQFGSAFVLLSLGMLRNVYLSVLLQFGLFVYYFNVIFTILLDLYPSIPSKSSINIVIEVCSIPVYLFTLFFVSICVLVAISFIKPAVRVSTNIVTLAPYGILTPLSLHHQH